MDKIFFYRLSEKKSFILIFFCVSFLLLVLRRPDAILLAQPWAEDGAILLQEAILFSWDSIFITYGDYLNLVPRLITLISLPLAGLAKAPLIMNISAIIIASGCSIFFSSKQFRFILKNDLLRLIGSLFILLTPGVFEIYSNIANIQWFLSFFLILFTLLLLFRYDEYEKKSLVHKIFYMLICFFIFLSAPTTFVLLPFFIFIIVRELKKNKLELKNLVTIIFPTTVLFFHIILFYFIRSSENNTFILNKGVLSFITVITSFVNLFSITLSKIFYHSTYDLFLITDNFAYFIPVGVIIFILVRSTKKIIKFELFLFLLIALILIFTIIARPSLSDMYQTLPSRGGERYLFIPMALSFILILRQFDANISLTKKLIVFILIIIIGINIVDGFSLPPFLDQNYQNMAERYDPLGQDECVIPIWPPGWSLRVPC